LKCPHDRVIIIHIEFAAYQAGSKLHRAVTNDCSSAKVVETFYLLSGRFDRNFISLKCSLSDPPWTFNGGIIVAKKKAVKKVAKKVAKKTAKKVVKKSGSCCCK